MKRAVIGHRAFTLVEMMIVTTILGILAVGMIGVVQNQTATARRIATEDTVFQTRQAIAIYRQQTGQLPNLLASWDALTKQTTVNGATVGPFLNRPPRNQCVPPDANPSCITDGNVPTLYLNQCSFLYDYHGGAGTGRFIASFDMPGSEPLATSGQDATRLALNSYARVRLREGDPELADKYETDPDLFSTLEADNPGLAAKLLAEFEASAKQ